MAIGDGGQFVASRAEDDVDLVMCDQETLRLSGRLEPSHDPFSSSCRPMTALDPVVEALVGPVIGAWCLMGNRLDVAAQFVCNDNPWLAELRDQPCHEALGSFGIPTRRHENIKRIAVGIDRPPEPVLHPVDRDHNLIQMPFVICHLSFGRGWSRRMQAAKCAPNRLTQRRIVSRLTMTPRWASRSSTSAVLSANR